MLHLSTDMTNCGSFDFWAYHHVNLIIHNNNNIIIIIITTIFVFVINVIITIIKRKIGGLKL